MFFLVYFLKSLYLCNIAQLVQQWAVGGLIYEKDVFERLSLWFVNLASSNLYNRQMTTRRLRGAFLYTLFIYSSCWRGLTALSILCREGNARAYEPRMGREQHLRLFCIKLNKETIIILVFLGCHNTNN